MNPWILVVALLAVCVWSLLKLRSQSRQLQAVRREQRETGLDRIAEQMKTTLAHMAEAVLVADDENQILLANDALKSLFPQYRDDPNWLRRLFRHESLTEHLRALREGEQPGRLEIEFSCDNTFTWVEVTGSRIPVFDRAGEEATLLIFHDVTRLRRLESVRKDFVANVSHELRTPLSLIKGYVETLIDDGPELAEEERRKFLAIIEKHTGRLERLVEDLLALSRLESGNPRLRREEVFVEKLLREAVDNIRTGGPGAERQFILDLEPNPVPIRADALRITQAIGNLLENAVKYTGPDVTIEAGTRQEKNSVRVWVRDSGVGISREDLPHIFERFYRVDKGRSRESGGTGLGLSIVKHIIQLHEGQIWADSAPGRGLLVAFTLPIAKTGD